MNEILLTRTINKYSSEKGMVEVEDILINEQVYELYINNQYITTLICTPQNLEELVVGHLKQISKISTYKDINAINISKNLIEVDVNSSNTVINDKNPSISLEPKEVLNLMNKHLDGTKLHKVTGGAHIMSIANNNEIIVSREDIGRHNAVDKLYGYCLINGIDLSDKIFLSSGRITYEIIKKVQKMGIKLIISRAAVSNLAFSIADESDITLIGFTRGERFNIYTYPERIAVTK